MKNSEHGLVLITGATSGIGAAYARRLAKDGFNLILHGRRQEKLKALALELEETHGISTEVLIAELSDPEGLKMVEERIQELDRLDMLINNAGYWTPCDFWRRDPDSIEALIRAHVIAPTRFTRAALPRMLKRNKGDIINVSSIAAYFNSATMENYCATKAYLISFSEALHSALTETSLRVQVLIPGYTLTDFHTRLGMNPEKISSKWMQPEDVVDISLNCLDKDCVVCVPRLKSRIIIKLMKSLWKWYQKLIPA